MKKNKLIFSLSIIVLAGSLFFTACKKKKETVPAVNENGQSSTDNKNVQSENDNATNDINTEIGNNTALHGRGATPNNTNSLYEVLGITTTPYTVDTTGAYLGTIKITYNGITEGNRKRTGSIKLTVQDYALGKRWKQAGCILKVDYLAYKITRPSDGKSVQLDGTQNITNETGGSWWELLIVKTQTSLATSVTGTNLHVTFEDNKSAMYNINRRFTYTIPGNILTCTGEGIGTSGTLTSLENYGTTRDGDAFTSQVTTPVVWNWTCGWWAPVQGAADIKVATKNFDLKVQFSVDANGNAVNAAANSCPYGWKVSWTYNNSPGKLVFGYL